MKISRSLSFCSIAMLALVSTLMVAPRAQADEAEIRALFPPATLLYGEITQPDKIADFLAKHPLTELIKQQPELQAALANNPQLKQGQAALKGLEEKLGIPLDKALKDVSAGGIYFGVDLISQGGAVIIQSKDSAVTQKVYNTLVEAAGEQAFKNGQPGPQPVEYEGVTGFKIDGKLTLFTIKDKLIASSSDKISQWIIRANQGKTTISLNEEPLFNKALSHRAKDTTGWVYFRTDVLRVFGIADKFKNATRDNPAGEFLLGGVLVAISEAPYITGEIKVEGDRIAVASDIPVDRKKLSAIRPFFFAPEGKGIEKPFHPDGLMLSVSMYRDLASLWNAAADLFDESIAAQLIKADTDIGTFFAGRSFGSDVLPMIDARLQLVVARQKFKADAPVPTVKVPAFALIGRTKNATLVQPVFKIAFQTIIGFVNIDGSQKGRPLLDVNMEKVGDATVVSASYLIMEDDKADMKKTNAPLYYNFSPSLVLSKDRFMFVSTRALALELAKEANERDALGEVQTQKENTLIEMDGRLALQLLKDNAKQLIAQNILEKGHTPEQAKSEIEMLLKIVDTIKLVDLKIVMDKDRMHVESGLTVDREKDSD